MANFIVLSIFAIYGFTLFGFKKLCLDRLQNVVIKYILAMVLAYGILVLIIVLGKNYEFINAAFLKANLRILSFKVRDPGMILYVVPAFYSVFVLGYFKNMGVKFIKVIMWTMFLNGFIAYFGAIFLNSYLDGKSVKEIYALAKESIKFIDWGYMALFVLLIFVFYYVMKYDYIKHHKKC